MGSKSQVIGMMHLINSIESSFRIDYKLHMKNWLLIEYGFSIEIIY